MSRATRKDKVVKGISIVINAIGAIEKEVQNVSPTWEDLEIYLKELNYLSSTVASLRLAITKRYADVEYDAAKELLLK